MEHLKWKKDFELGIAEIDDQHKTLIAIMDKLRGLLYNPSNSTAFTSGDKEGGNIMKILDEMADYANFHFTAEENHLRQFDCPGLRPQLIQHEFYRKKTRSLKNKLAKGEISVAYEALDFLENWFISHILAEDLKFVPCFHGHGL